MAWFDWILGPLDFIDMGIHTVARNRRTRARNRRARTMSAAVYVKVPHPDSPICKEPGNQVPTVVEVKDHLEANGVRTWYAQFDGAWLYLVVRESQKEYARWLLGNSFTVTSRDQMKTPARRWKGSKRA